MYFHLKLNTHLCVFLNDKPSAYLGEEDCSLFLRVDNLQLKENSIRLSFSMFRTKNVLPHNRYTPTCLLCFQMLYFRLSNPFRHLK